MKKILISLSLPLLLSLGISASAALPKEGIYLDKDGSPVTEEQMVPPSLKSAKMLPQTQAVHDALFTLPHSVSTVLLLSINEDGAVTHEEVAESSSSIVLDQYAASSAESWSFRPARRGDKAVPFTVRIPVRFTSSMTAVPPQPLSQVMSDMTEKERTAAEEAGHPSLSVRISIDQNGKMDKAPEVIKEGTSLSDENFKILSRYIERSLRQWTFSPARNPDGENIAAETTLSLQM